VQRFTEFDFGVSWVMGFFHQDWCHDGPTAAGVVAKNLADVDDEYVLAVRRDTQTLLDGLPSKTLEVLWDAGADYLSSFEQIGEGAQWTRTVVALCDARLSAKAGARPLAGADMEDGVALSWTRSSPRSRRHGSWRLTCGRRSSTAPAAAPRSWPFGCCYEP
jgi:hypothetical protein